MRKLGFGAGVAAAAFGAIWIGACGGDDASSGGGPDDASAEASSDASGDAPHVGLDGAPDADDGGTIVPVGDGGLVTTTSPWPSDDIPVALLEQPDGKYVAVCGNVDHYGVVMARVNANGALDATFGQGGLTWGYDTYARSAALQTDGKIVVAGYAGIARWDASGALDTSFKPPVGIGQAGVVNVEGIALQPDGKILAAGTDGSDLRVHRLLTTGALDTTFDSDGVTTVGFGTQSSAYSVAVHPTSGKIAAVGYAGGQLALAVFNADGSPDTTFNGTGKVTGAGAFTGSQGWAVVFQSDGKIVVSGSGAGEGGSGAVAARYTATGAIDATFATGGVYWGGTSGAFQSIKLRSNGSLVFGAGDRYVQLTSSGALDGTFGSSGVANFAGLPQPAYLSLGVALGSDGSLAGLGALMPGGDGQAKAIWRMTSAGVLDTTFGTGGEVSFAFHARQDEAHTMVAQPDGKVVLAGRSTGAGMIARYLPSGDLDPTFSDGGVRFGGEELHDVVLGDGGTIYVANGFGAEAITPAGDHDQAFGGDAGTQNLYLPSGDWFAPRAIALDAAGRVVVAGYGGGARPEHVGVIRFLPNGARDTTFATNGAYEGPTDNERIFAVAVDASQRIVLGGFTGSGANPGQKAMLVRLDTSGALDATFDGDTGTGNGIVTVGSGMARALAVQPDGKLLVLANTGGGFFDTYDTGATAVMRFGPDGKLDASFGTGGIVDATSFPSFSARGMQLRPDGSILLAGTKANALAAMRLTSTGAVDPTFGSAGAFVAPGGEPGGGWAIVTPSAGDPWLAGYVVRSPTGSDFALIRAR